MCRIEEGDRARTRARARARNPEGEERSSTSLFRARARARVRARSSSYFMAIVILLVLAGCHYRFEDQVCEERRVSLTIPYVQGDTDGMLTDELTRQCAQSGLFECVQNGGEYTLKVKMIADSNNRIGYRYDRNAQTGQVKKNLIPVEYRRSVLAEVTFIRSCSEEVIFGPEAIFADGEFDSVNPSVLDDLTFVNPLGIREKIIQFSLGQLDSEEGGTDNVRVPLYRQLAQSIVDGMINHL